MMRGLLFPGCFATLVGLVGGSLLAPSEAEAHTTQICWQDEGPVTTFYAGTYHSPNEGPSPVGGIIIDGFEYPFSGWINPTALPAGAECQYNLRSTGPNVVHYQTFTSGFEGGSHTVSFTATNAVQAPWGPFPPLVFGGGACADADFDGICNDVDTCPLDFSNDGDGDGICANLDNCPLDANPDQADNNGNGQGDICEGLICGNGLLQGGEQCDDGNRAGGDGCSAICTIEAADAPPNADAGIDLTANEGEFVGLDASASNDADGDALTFAWAQIGGTVVALADPTTPTPSLTAPFVAIGGETLTFELTVTANGLTATDQVNVQVVNVNHQPVGDAGADQSVAEGSPVLLDGTASFDIDSDPVTYAWTQVGGTGSVTLSDTDTATPSFAAPLGGGGGAPGVVDTLVFELTVDDGYFPDAPVSGYAIGDNVARVTVEITNVNNDPTANAGGDVTVNENGAVQLNGNASGDSDGDALSFSWSQSGGAPVTLTGASTPAPSLTTPFVSAGGEDLTFEVTVADGYGGVASDQVVVHVQNANDPPNADLARATVGCLWPPNHKLVEIGIVGVSDPEDNATITIDSVDQDEPIEGLGDGDTAPDAVVGDDGTALLRAERSGKGDGRVYHVAFTASDLEGSSSGVVTVCVQHNKKKDAVDGGPLYDSTE